MARRTPATFPPGTLVPTERFVVTVEEPADTPVELALSGGTYTPGTTWTAWPIDEAPDWQNLENFGNDFAKPLILRAHLRSAHPLAVNDTFTVTAGATLTASVAGNDRLYPDGGNAWETITTTVNGTLNFANATGNFTYQPHGGFVGTDTFTYQMCDIDAECTTATATISVLGPDVFSASKRPDRQLARKQDTARFRPAVSSLSMPSSAVPSMAAASAMRCQPRPHTHRTQRT